MDIKWADIKADILPCVGILAAVYVFGKIVDKNVDTDKNWNDYCKSKKNPPAQS